MNPETLAKLGVVGTLVMVLALILAGKLVPGFIYRRALVDRDKQTELAAEATATAKAAHQSLDRIMGLFERRPPQGRR